MLGARKGYSWNEVGGGGGLGRYVPKILQDEDTATWSPRDVSKARLPVTVGGGLVNLRLWMWLS